MNIADLVELSLYVGLFVLVLLLFAGAIRHRPGRTTEASRMDRLRKFGRYTAARLPIAIGTGLAIFVLGASALTLNSHRPPGDTDPVVVVPSGTRDATVTLDLTECGESARFTVRVNGAKGLVKGPAKFYSDAAGWRRVELTATGNATYASLREEKPTEKRSLLSCYMLLPVVKGASRGYQVKVKLPNDAEVDRDTSVPSPDAYSDGLWVWQCEAGERCPGFAAINDSVEDGTKQVIVLVLASVFGALIALLVGEILIEWARRRNRERSMRE